jgi:hypothetical protein
VDSPGGSALASEVIRRERSADPPYVILVTAKSGKTELAEGLGSGANDYIAKPFDPVELKARLDVGLRVLALQDSLRDRVQELESALARIRARGIIDLHVLPRHPDRQGGLQSSAPSSRARRALQPRLCPTARWRLRQSTTWRPPGAPQESCHGHVTSPSSSPTTTRSSG